ncbi:MAG: hypothetical protein PVJ53_15585 [Desulfobacterales bacterium]|jgi:hypothetical protein
MLAVTIIPDSPVAEIFARKCCGGGLPDQSLEIRIVNRGAAALDIQSRFRLEQGAPALEWTAVCPAGGRHVAPGDVVALYADMDPARLTRYRVLVLFDRQGRSYRFPLGVPASTLIGTGEHP